MVRAEDRVVTILRDNQSSYSFLNTCTGIYPDFPRQDLSNVNNFPRVSILNLPHSGTLRAIGGGGSQITTVPVQIDVWVLKNQVKTVASVNYKEDYLCKKIMSDIASCLRTKIMDDNDIWGYQEMEWDKPMGAEEWKNLTVYRRTSTIIFKEIDTE